MKKRFKLGIIGCGFAAQTIMRGAVLSDFLNERKIIVSDILEENLDNVGDLGVFTTDSNAFVAENSEYLLFAVQRQDYEKAVNSLKNCKVDKVISVVTGLKKNTIKNSFGVNAVKVARCALSLPCSIGSGVIGVDMSDFNRFNDDTEFISNLFNCLGTVLSVDESKIDLITALSGIGVSASFMFVDSLVDAGVKIGLSKQEAKIVATQVLSGSAEMVSRDEQSLTELIKQSCSKGGVGLEAVKAFDNGNFSGTVNNAVDSGVKKLKEFSEK